jgi:hypothetical protein
LHSEPPLHRCREHFLSIIGARNTKVNEKMEHLHKICDRIDGKEKIKMKQKKGDSYDSGY